MLPTEARLRRGGDVVAAMRRGKRAHVAPLTLHVRLATTGPGAGSARVAFVVPKAVGGAVVRNLVKRRLRHIVRDRIAGLPPGADVVVRASPPAASIPAASLAVAFDRALARAMSDKAGR